MKIVPIFSEYIIEFDYPDHEKYNEQWKKIVLDKKYKYEKIKNKFITHSKPNLHKQEEFLPLADFMSDCISKGMNELGFQPDFSITSMWYTYQNEGLS